MKFHNWRGGKVLSFLIVFFVVSLCLVVEWWWFLPAERERPACPVVWAATDIAEGVPLVPAHFEIRWQPSASDQDCERRYFTEAQLDKVVAGGGKWVTTEPLSAGHPILPGQLRRDFSAPLPRGRKAYALRLDSPLQVRVGDTVEVFLASEQPFEPVAHGKVLQSRRDTRGGALSLVLALTRSQIRDMEKARQQGKLSIALIHPADVDSLPASRARTRSVRARIWHENQD